MIIMLRTLMDKAENMKEETEKVSKKMETTEKEPEGSLDIKTLQ